VLRPESNFTAVIEQLTSDKLKLTAELNKSNDQATKAIELKELADEEITRLNLIMQRNEIDEQHLNQEVQRLTGIVEFLRNTTVNSVDEFLDRLKNDLNPLSDR